MNHIEVNRVHKDYGFEATDAYGHRVRLDTSPETGGENFGVRPMQMVLMGLGACSGIDVISILKKQKQHVKNFRVSIDGEREQGKEATLWKNVKVTFELEGKIDPEKARRACELSIDKYCSVAATLTRGGSKIEWEVKVENSE